MRMLKEVIIGLISLIKGMKVTLKYFFKPAKTLIYPKNQPKIPAQSRGMLKMIYDEKTKVTKCTACNTCVLACPVKAIEVIAEKDPETNKQKLKKYVFYHQKCMYCGLCTEACPFKAIDWDQSFEHASQNKSKKEFPYELKENANMP